jgi:hypothetical protein
MKVEPQRTRRPKRRKRPTVRTRRRAEVAVSGDADIHADLIASTSRRLRRVDPPEVLPEPQPELLSMDDDADDDSISWADDVEELRFEDNPEFSTDVDDYDSPAITIIDED